MSSWPKVDPYVLLDVPRRATEADIKKAYRTLARQLHPVRAVGRGGRRALTCLLSLPLLSLCLCYLTPPIRPHAPLFPPPPPTP